MFAGLTGLSIQVYNSLHSGDPLTPLCANVIYESTFHFYFQWIPVVLAEAPKEAPQGAPQEVPQEATQEVNQEVAQVEQVY